MSQTSRPSQFLSCLGLSRLIFQILSRHLGTKYCIFMLFFTESKNVLQIRRRNCGGWVSWGAGEHMALYVLAHWTPIQGSYNVHTTPIQRSYNAHTTPIQRPYNAHTTPMCLWGLLCMTVDMCSLIFSPYLAHERCSERCRGLKKMIIIIIINDYYICLVLITCQ